MDAGNLAAVASIASAVVAVAAAVSSERSANRSAAAEERTARAAEDAVVIERERLAHERRDRAEREAPRLDAGHAHGWTWAFNHRTLEGGIYNLGPTTAIVEHVELEAGGQRQDGAWDASRAVLAPGDHLSVEFVWDGRDAGSPVVVHVQFRADGRTTARPPDTASGGTAPIIRGISDGAPTKAKSSSPRVVSTGLDRIASRHG